MNLAESDHDEVEEESDEIWLISYADLMTLLFGLFVLMYSFALARSPEKVEKVKEGVARSFGGSYLSPYANLQEDIKVEVRKNALLQDIAIEPLRDGLEITFQSGLMFASGDSQLSNEMKLMLEKIIEVIASNVENDDIVIEGHTDDVPINSDRFPSNWELSAVRASSVVREFIKNGFDPSKINAVGFADSRPLVPNKDKQGIPIPQNRAKNRRVVVKIIAQGYIDSRSESEAQKN